MIPADPRVALEVVFGDVELLRAVATQADADLRAAAGEPSRLPELPALRRARDTARAVVTEAESKLPALRIEVAKVEQTELAAAERQRQEEERALADEARQRAAAELSASLAAPLAALERAGADANDANDRIAAARASRRPLDVERLVAVALTGLDLNEAGALTLGSVTAEELVHAAADVETIDPRHPAAREARGVAAAMWVHAGLADVADGLALLCAARALAAEALTRIAAGAARHPDRPALSLALAAARLDAARSPLPVTLGAHPVSTWLGCYQGTPEAMEREALTRAASLDGPAPRYLVPAVPGAPAPLVTPAEVGTLVLAGRGSDVGVLVAQREADARLNELVTATADDRSGPVGQARAAAAELRHGRASGQWYGTRETREPYLRALQRAGLEFIGEQIMEQSLSAKCRGSYLVSTAPGRPQVVDVPTLAPQIPAGPFGATRHGAPAPARDQIVAFLHLAPEDVDLLDGIALVAADIEAAA